VAQVASEAEGRGSRGELALVLGLAIASSLATALPFAWNGTLYHDTLHAFSFTAENLDSLNRFGEPAWWSPNVTAGMPAYFYGMLGQPNLARPSFVAIGAVAWGLGQLDVRLPSALPFYVFSFGFLIPLLFLVGVWLVARRVLRSRVAVAYALVLAAFSPGVLVNLGDPGILENTAYALFATAALLRFVGRPTRKSFAILAAALLLLALGASQMLLATAAPMLLALVLALLAFSRGARRAARAIPPAPAAAAFVALAIVVLPSALAYRQQHAEIVHADLGRELGYAFGELKSGNPLQLVVASVPGVGFDWDVYKQPRAGPPAAYQVLSLQDGAQIGNNYLGLLAIPLAAIGLVAGRRRVRVPLFAIGMLVATTYLMYGASPLFAPALVAFAPLRTLNHFGDMLHGGGAFLVVAFAAALGLETLERRPDWLRRVALGFPIWSALGLVAFGRFAAPPPELFAFVIATSVAFAACFLLASRTRSKRWLVAAVAISLVDVATLSFFYLRGIHGGAERVDESRTGDSIAATTRLARVFMLRETKRLAEAGIAVDALPLHAVFCAATAENGPITPAQIAAGFEGAPAQRRVVLRADAESAPVLAAFATPPARCDVAVGLLHGTYNELRVTLEASQPALFLVRDGYAPEWRASVNGAPVPVHRAFGAFKAVAIPAGRSRLLLRYEPPGVAVALIAAYAVVVLAAMEAFRMRD